MDIIHFFLIQQTGENNVAIGKFAAGSVPDDCGIPCDSFSNFTAIGTGVRPEGHKTVLIGKGVSVIGNESTALGFEATVIGVNSTAVGYQASVTGNNSMAIGNGTIVTANNTIFLGNTSISNIRGQVAFNTYSDKRIKDNIKEDVVGLDFIKHLRPITYNLNVDKQNNIMGVINKGKNLAKYEGEKIRRTGFIAQEVEVSAIKSGYNFSGIVRPKNKKDLYGLSYAEFVVPLVKAVQEQSVVIEDLLERVKNLTERVEQLEMNKK